MILFDKVMQRLGYVRAENTKMLDDLWADAEYKALHTLCRSFTMTSEERMFSVVNAVRYVLTNNIPGDFVECGVWKGGSSMIMAKMLQDRSITDRSLYLYDTYEGMSAPGEEDVDLRGNAASSTWKKEARDGDQSNWCYSTLDEVKGNFTRTGFPQAQIHYVKGKVEDTIPGVIPGQIALLRLDTDWFDSTYHELVHMFPLLSPGGVLIIDDYGYWQGARKAVDQYFKENGIAPLLNRIDDTGRIYQKP
jgi:O-methyltransferase